MDLQISALNELSPEQVYDFLQLRSDVFVMEQDCLYRDIDELDKHCLHLLGRKDGSLVAYLRIIPPNLQYREKSSIGRVVVHPDFRNYKAGTKIMEKAIEYLQTHSPNSAILIHAQTYLKKFYSSLGFEASGNYFLEDNIPHLEMILTSK